MRLYHTDYIYIYIYPTNEHEDECNFHICNIGWKYAMLPFLSSEMHEQH